MDSSFWFDTINLEWFRGHMLKFPNKIVFVSLKIIFVLTNSVDTDEMMHYVAFHLSLHC